MMKSKNFSDQILRDHDDKFCQLMMKSKNFNDQILRVALRDHDDGKFYQLMMKSKL